MSASPCMASLGDYRELSSLLLFYKGCEREFVVGRPVNGIVEGSSLLVVMEPKGKHKRSKEQKSNHDRLSGAMKDGGTGD